MPDRPWKTEERRAAALFGGQRYPANTGGARDFETSRYVGQVKHVRRLSLTALEALAREVERLGLQQRPLKLGVVVVKRRAGKGAEDSSPGCPHGAAWRKLTIASKPRDKEKSEGGR